jgi:rhamnosyltransferase
MNRLGIYCCVGPSSDHFVDDYQLHCLRAFRPLADVMYVVAGLREGSPRHGEVRAAANLVVRAASEFTWPGEGYRQVLANIDAADLEKFDEILLFDSTAFGPIFPAREMFDAMAGRDCDYWSAGYFDTRLDKRFDTPVGGGRLPTWNLMVLRKPVLQPKGFRDFWAAMPQASDYWSAFTGQELAFGAFLHEQGFKGATYIDPERLKTSDPRLFEAWKLIEQRMPLVSRALFTLDGIVQDMQALQPRRTLELIRAKTTYDTELIWKSLLRTQKLRELETGLDIVSVLPTVRPPGAKTKWKLGPVAVLAHAFYPEMIDEIAARAACIPTPADLYVTTAGAETREAIAERLKGFKRGKVEVRVVEQNRGRDMSSLFITLRDVVLSGKYDLCLRLHSKRTPQMSPHISETFMDHLVENLAANRAYVANLFDLLERDANVGLVIPPVIHIGFGTLGHSWFSNRADFAKVAKALGLDVPFDDFTPVAPYGTMYWFRCKALRAMFEHEWKWSDYNPEPHHVDGGLAHIQERLIAYVAQKQGYRTETVMSTELAGRYYAKLEYKLQLLASCYPSAMISKQYAVALADKARRDKTPSRQKIAIRIAERSKRMRVRFPIMWQMSRPLAKRIWPVVKKLLNHR